MVFVSVANEMATITQWPLVIAMAAISTALGHFLNCNSIVGAIVCTIFCAVFPY